MSRLKVLQVKVVLASNGSCREAASIDFCHDGQLLISVCSRQIVSVNARMRTLWRATTGAFSSIVVGFMFGLLDQNFVAHIAYCRLWGGPLNSKPMGPAVAEPRPPFMSA